MKTLFISIVIFFLILPYQALAQQTPVNYGPEWESIKKSYQKIADTFTRQRQQVLNNPNLSNTLKKTQIQMSYHNFMAQSRKLAARRGEIIRIAAERSGLKYTLGSDPATGRGMAGDIDLGGTPQQAKKIHAGDEKPGNLRCVR